MPIHPLFFTGARALRLGARCGGCGLDAALRKEITLNPSIESLALRSQNLCFSDSENTRIVTFVSFEELKFRISEFGEQICHFVYEVPQNRMSLGVVLKIRKNT